MTTGKTTPFDFVRSITESKEDIYEGNESAYNRFIINRALSMNVDCLFFVHEAELYNVLPDRVHYEYLLNSIDSKKRYGKWVKKDALPDNLELIKEAYGYSTKEALSVLGLLSDKQLLELQDTFRKGGRR